ncbi:hypothetical protein KIH74_26760 [Kineosporia sp. J2-2]|uniref:GH26 domain-containing protein n=1 Tax=Kineosporia corallincola TaxID=2835133 RepID=A0ABS5TQD8_9ACTN|nr:glycosyl hydrolase [Kineosporia corallincola]MBT0772574.1 hypothetical protein [Kineosporia corallincola]
MADPVWPPSPGPTHPTADSPSRRELLTLGAAAGVTALTAAALAGGQLLRRPRLAERCRFGAYSSLGGDLLGDHLRLEQSVGARLPLFSWFKDWNTGWEPWLADQLAARPGSYDCMLAWEAWGVGLGDIVRGWRDDYLWSFFDGAARYPGRVIVRLFHEMNGSWYPWSLAGPQRTVTDAGQFRDAWRHVVDLARAHGTPNLQFLFCPNAFDDGGTPMEEYWPGADLVDLIGLDGYNWGWLPDGSPQHDPEALIRPMYDRLCALHPNAAFLVGEIGCAPGPGTARWYEDLYRSTSFSRLTGLAFFNQRKERDWRLDADPAALRVHRHYLRQRHS